MASHRTVSAKAGVEYAKERKEKEAEGPRESEPETPAALGLVAERQYVEQPDTPWIDMVLADGEVVRVSTSTALTDAGFLPTKLGSCMIGMLVGKEEVPSNYTRTDGKRVQEVFIFEGTAFVPLEEETDGAVPWVGPTLPGVRGGQQRWWLIKEGRIKVGVTDRIRHLSAPHLNGTRLLLTVRGREADKYDDKGVKQRSGALVWHVAEVSAGPARGA